MGPLALGLMGGGIGALGSILGGQSASRAGNRVAGMMKNAWQPVNTTTGFGQASFDPATGQFTTGLTGTAADYQNMLFAQAMGEPSATGQGLFTQGQSFLDQMASVDPTERFNLMQQIMQPAQQQETGGAIANLFAKGMLGSAGGAGLMSSVAQGQELAKQNAALQAMDAAARERENLFRFGTGMMGMGADLTQQDLMNRLAAGSQATGMFGLEQGVGDISRGLGASRMSALSSAAPFQFQAQSSNPLAALMGGAGGSLMNMGMMGMMGGM